MYHYIGGDGREMIILRKTNKLLLFISLLLVFMFQLFMLCGC